VQNGHVTVDVVSWSGVGYMGDKCRHRSDGSWRRSKSHCVSCECSPPMLLVRPTFFRCG